MQLSWTRQQLYHLVHHSSNFNLAEAALYIAQEEYPDLDIGVYLNALDMMADAIRKRLPQPAYPLRTLQIINQYLYEELGFSANHHNYYDPRNSFLNDVIDRRTGIPITLGLIYLEVAQRIEFPMVGINFPGHFLIRPDHEDMDIFIDPFNKGDLLFEQDCQARLSQLVGRSVELLPSLIQPITPHQFLVRMLTNLKQIYRKTNQLQKCLTASERILLISPGTVGELRDRGILYYQLGCWEQARQDLEDYLVYHPQAKDGPLLTQLLRHLGKGV